jgi:formate hydrogenlyase transcriptional activator
VTLLRDTPERFHRIAYSVRASFRTRQVLTAVCRYALALASVAAALETALFLRHYGLPHPFTSFSFAAIAITFWYAGTGPGSLALFLSCLATSHFFVPLRIHGSSESYLIIYGIFSVSVAWFSASRQRAERLLTEARDSLEVRVAQRTGELTRTNEELQDTQSALQAEKDRLKLLLELTNNLVSTLNIREALKTVIGSLRHVTQSDFVGVCLPDSENERLQVYMFNFIADGDCSDRELVLGDDSLPVRVFRTGMPWTGKAEDLSESRQREDSLVAPELKTLCVLPLSGRDRALGILVLGRRADHPYAPDDIGFLGQVSNQIGIAVENALSYRQIAELTEKLSQEKLYLEDEIRTDANFEEIIGTSAALRRILKLVETVAPTQSTVLIYGETGTGKELIARAIHNLSPRREKTFVRLNCAAIPTGLLESELFGHERGAFTGAVAQRIGRLELADRGTLFLDEVGEIPLELQPKLLRVLQEREFERLGSTRTLCADVRLIAATNRNLEAMVGERKFRSDLFFRLNVFPIEVPPLRERAEDIPLLVRHFAKEFSRRMNKTIETIPSEAMRALCQYGWPGNIRELQNVIERAVILSSRSSLKVPVAELQPYIPPEPAAEIDPSHSRSTRRRPVRSILAEVDPEQIVQALKEANGRVGGPEGAASLLGLKRTTFLTRMKKLGINPSALSEGDATNADSSDTAMSGTGR